MTIFFFSPLFAGSQSVIIKAMVDKNKITIGDRITYTLTIEHPFELKNNVKLPDVGANLDAFEIKNYEIIKPKKRKGKIIHTFKYILTTFTTGKYNTPNDQENQIQCGLDTFIY